jgi:hypothetical protein
LWSAERVGNHLRTGAAVATPAHTQQGLPA